MTMRASLRFPDRYAGMNATEKEWALQIEARVRQGGKIHEGFEEVWPVAWHYESIRFKLAPKTWYLPDFYVLYSDGHVELHEVKAEANFRRNRSKNWKTSAVKLKTAAELYPQYTWCVAMAPMEPVYYRPPITDEESLR